MDSSSFFLTFVAVAIGFFMVFRKFRSHQENKEFGYSSLSTSSPPSSLSISSVPPSSFSISSVPPSSLSIQSSPPSSSSHNWTHDVFPSFRGEDVRRDFLSHIQRELERKGITPFNDNGIKRGESIGPELKRAIRESKIAIVMLSRNYASSTWCLEELVEIMKCKEELGQTVMVIFYKVDPSDVKKLTGIFGKVFKKTCVGKTEEDIGRWSQALKKVATIAGYHSRNWNTDAAMIERIAVDVSNELINSVPSRDFDGFVGMGAHMMKMEPFFLLGSDEVRMVGIWGPSGIGKSTIARFLFSKYSHQFQLSVFMENIKRRYPRPCYDEYSAKLQLQKEFLSQIISHEDINIHHLGVAQDRLKDKRVLVVLDDVDHLMQLDALAKEARWFGLGSRIIITTQDKRLLKAHGIDHIYKVDFPPDAEALQIFYMYAFGQKYPYDDFEKLAWEITKLAGKLPLALRVMGSYLKGMPKQEWEEELPRLRISLDGETESVLKFSYDALCDEDQDLFLRIACCFNYKPTEKVEAYLAENFSGVKGRLRALAEKSLISIISSEYIEMHDLLQRLGREIVRKQSICEVGQRQFLVDDRDICQVLRNDSVGSRSVIGIDMKYCLLAKELKISDRAFETMSNLQFLRLQCDNIHIKSMNNLSPKLILLDLDNSPMTCLPCNFNPEFLVEINMPRSELEKLWEGIKAIRNLKWMDLSYSKNLKELPDLSTATNLQELKLRDCSSLVKLPSSISNAINLRRLDLSNCSSLVELPFFIGNATNLRRLNFGHCSSLVKLPSSIGKAINLEELDLTYCTSLVELPFSIGSAINLRKVKLSCCSSLVKLPTSIGNAINIEILNLNRCSSLVEFPSSIWNIVNLVQLDLSYCSSLLRLPSSSSGNAINLKELNLFQCTSLVELPSSMENATKLEYLNVAGCISIVELPSSMGNLRNLYLNDCSSLVELPSFFDDATYLRKLELRGCSSLVKLPSIENITNVKKLYLNRCSSLVELPSYIGNAISLIELDLSGCTSLMVLPSSIGNMANLKYLYFKGCSSLLELPSSIGDMTSLMWLYLNECSSLLELPSSIENLHNLQTLDLTGCSELKTLPININMRSLVELDLTDCSSLKTFPEISTNIRVLKLKGTAIQEIPPSIRSCYRLDSLHMSYSENLSKSMHAFDLITELHLSDTRIQEIPPCVKEMSCLHTLVIKGCTKLVSLPQLPDSLGILYAQNCESLERLDCSFSSKEFLSLDFANCFKLNQEARDLIIKTSTREFAVFPGETVPTYFTYRDTGSFLSMKSNGFDTHFKACVLLVPKGFLEGGSTTRISCRIKDKLNGAIVASEFGDHNWFKSSPTSKEHLYVFEFEKFVSSTELVFEFEVSNQEWEIKECGLRTPETQAPWC